MTTRWLALLVSLPIVFAMPAGIAQAEDEEVLLESLLQEVTRTLIKVRDGSESDALPPLKSAALKIQSEIRQSAGGGVSFWVITAKAKASRLAVQTLEIGLEPPKPVDGQQVSAISDALAGAILAAAKAARVAAEGRPPLRMTSVKTTLKFVVEKSAGAEAGIKLLPITGSISADVSDSATQEISLIFQTP